MMIKMSLCIYLIIIPMVNKINNIKSKLIKLTKVKNYKMIQIKPKSKILIKETCKINDQNKQFLNNLNNNLKNNNPLTNSLTLNKCITCPNTHNNNIINKILNKTFNRCQFNSNQQQFLSNISPLNNNIMCHNLHNNNRNNTMKTVMISLIQKVIENKMNQLILLIKSMSKII